MKIKENPNITIGKSTEPNQIFRFNIKKNSQNTRMYAQNTKNPYKKQEISTDT